MNVIRRRGWEMPESRATPEHLFFSRRSFLGAGAGVAATGLTPSIALAQRITDQPDPTIDLYPGKRNEKFTLDRPITDEKINGNYNNFYEFNSSKNVAKQAQALKIRPWTIKIDGMVEKPIEVGIDDLVRKFGVEERLYRHRCVEAWSMVVPWMGIALGKLIDRLEPTSRAKYVEFTTLLDPRQMPGQQRAILEWPYTEGLRMDEARHPLTLLVTGLYGKPLPNQNGAPLRLVVPWKYGFKGGKSLVRIRFTERQPRTTWNLAAPDEYGFYANVNPEVDHPRWSQARERRVGEFFKRKTLPFNGYAEQVASLYAGMDLRKNF